MLFTSALFAIEPTSLSSDERNLKLIATLEVLSDEALGVLATQGPGALSVDELKSLSSSDRRKLCRTAAFIWESDLGLERFPTTERSELIAKAFVLQESENKSILLMRRPLLWLNAIAFLVIAVVIYKTIAWATLAAMLPLIWNLLSMPSHIRQHGRAMLRVFALIATLSEEEKDQLFAAMRTNKKNVKRVVAAINERRKPAGIV